MRLSNEDQAVYDIHDIVKAYYKVAIKRFMDNVVVWVVERSWLGPVGFIGMFDGEFVGRLSDEELASIAAENYSTTNVGADLKEKLRRFGEARRIAKSIWSFLVILSRQGFSRFQPWGFLLPQARMREMMVNARYVSVLQL